MAVRRRLDERMKWPSEQRVPTAWNPKQIKGQTRKFTRILGVGLGVVVLAGFTGAALNDGLYRYIAREEVVRTDKPGCPSYYAAWDFDTVPAATADDRATRERTVLRDVFRSLNVFKSLEDDASLGQIAEADKPAIEDAVIDAAQSGGDLSLDLGADSWATANRDLLSWTAQVAYTRLRTQIAECTTADNESRAATGRQMLVEMSAIAQALAFLAFSVTVLLTTNWLLTSLLVILLAMNIGFAFKTIVLTRRDMKLDKIARIEQGASNAVDGILLEVFGEWRRYLEVERKAFLERFAEQVARNLGRPGEDAIARFSIIEQHLKADAKLVANEMRKQDEQQKNTEDAVNKARARLKTSLARALGDLAGGR